VIPSEQLASERVYPAFFLLRLGRLFRLLGVRFRLLGLGSLGRFGRLFNFGRLLSLGGLFGFGWLAIGLGDNSRLLSLGLCGLG
jgi:hypothetical protein